MGFRSGDWLRSALFPVGRGGHYRKLSSTADHSPPPAHDTPLPAAGGIADHGSEKIDPIIPYYVR